MHRSPTGKRPYSLPRPEAFSCIFGERDPRPKRTTWLDPTIDDFVQTQRRGLKAAQTDCLAVAKHLTQAAPEVSKVLFENDKVRVVELNVKKGTKVGMHTHPAYFAYAVTSFDYTSTSAGGKSEKRKVKESGVDWRDGESHSVEFTKPARALVVELK